MAGLVRTRATKAQKRYTKPAGKAAFAKMTVAASEVVIRNRGMQYRSGNPEYVLFELPHWCVFSEDFPKGVIVERTSLANTHKINAVRLLDWLHKYGHSAYDSRMLVKQTRQFEMLSNSIDKMIEGD